MTTSAQQRFNEIYISSTQIMIDLNISRATLLYARTKGILKDCEAISVNDGQLYLWERSLIQPKLDTWKEIIDYRRGA